MNQPSAGAVRPSPAVVGVQAYSPPARPPTVDLRLDSNEGAAPDAELCDFVSNLGTEAMRRYPNAHRLETVLAERLQVGPRQVLVTGGADDALDRACRATLGPGRDFIIPVPSFEMFERYAQLTGARAVAIAWPHGPFPTEDVIRAVGPNTGAIAIATPNNPTGATADADDLQRLSRAVPHALLLVDLAYTEFADIDLTPVALQLPNAVVVRTFSKAWGMAGLRVGYAVGPVRIIDWLRAAGSPYPTSNLSLAAAIRRLENDQDQVRAFVERVRYERVALGDLLGERGADALPSQANFVLARFRDAKLVSETLAAAGIAVRSFEGRPGLEDRLRITCPGEADAFARLTEAFDAAYAADPAAF